MTGLIKNRPPTEGYWAADDDLEVVVGTLQDRANDFYERVSRRGLWEVWRRSYRVYFGIDEHGYDHETSRISFQGAQGELSSIRSNHYRNLIRHQVNLAIQTRPEFTPRARNADVKSVAHAKIARGMLEYVMRERGLEASLVTQVEASLVFGEAYQWLYWDSTEPGPYGEPGAGDISCEMLTPLDVVVDSTRSSKHRDWVIVRQPINKWDLIAQFPEFEEEISTVSSSIDTFRYTIGQGQSGDLTSENEDQIFVYHWYHRRTEAMPQGAYMMFCNAEAILVPRTDLPFSEIPVYRMAPSELIGQPFAYGDNWDLIGLQRAYDAALSCQVTNLDAFGVPNIAYEKGTDIAVDTLAGGLNTWEIQRGAQVPQVVQMLGLPSDSYRIPDVLKADMEALSGINSTMRGAPDSNIKSGAMAALFRGMSQEFNSSLLRTYTSALTEVSTGVVQMYKRFADGQRMAIISGTEATDELRVFEKSELEDVDRFVVELQSPIENNAAGRMEIAKMFYEKGELTAEEFMHVARTGEFPTKWQAPKASRNLIREENERLLNLEPVTVAITDDHPRHIQEHAALLDTYTVREDPQIQDHVMGHVLKHMDLWRKMELKAPGLAAVLGIPPAPMLSDGPGAPPPPPGAPPPTPGGPPPAAMAGQEQSEANTPGLPVDPSTAGVADVPPPPTVG